MRRCDRCGRTEESSTWGWHIKQTIIQRADEVGNSVDKDICSSCFQALRDFFRELPRTEAGK
jgi:hypothetical protein